MLLGDLAESLSLRDHLVKETGSENKNAKGHQETHDLEPLIQLGVFPENLSLRLGELRMVLVRVYIKDLGRHPFVVRELVKRTWIT